MPGSLRTGRARLQLPVAERAPDARAAVPALVRAILEREGRIDHLAHGPWGADQRSSPSQPPTRSSSPPRAW